MGIEIKVAESVAEETDVFKLRYEVFVEELGYQVPVIRDGMLTDCFDDNSHIIVAYDNGNLVGSIRSNGAYEGKLPFEYENKVRDIFKLEYPRVSTTSKIAIKKEYRSTILAYKLVSYIYRMGLQNNVLCDIIDVQRPELIDFYSRLGYRVFGSPFNSEEYGVLTPMVLHLFDVDHLNSVKSPFIRILYEFNKNNENSKVSA